MFRLTEQRLSSVEASS